MDKPVKKCHIYAYDYRECRDYLQARDGYDERDYASKFQGDAGPPYQDFWHFVLDKDPEIHNGCEVVMDESWAEGAEPWQQEILRKYLDAFGETGLLGERVVNVYVWW